MPASASVVDVIPRQRVSDPDFWLGVAAWALIVFSCLQILLMSFGRDQSIYAVVGDGLLRGQMPYRDLWDFKPPGIFLVYAFAQAVFGKSMVAIRLVEVLGLVGLVFGMRRIAEACVGNKLVGLVGGALAIFSHANLEFWHTAQPEAFGGMLIGYALSAMTPEPARQRWRWIQWAGVGALFGGAFLLKPTLGGGVLVCAAYLARRELSERHVWWAALRPLAAIGLGSWVPILACLSWFTLAGAWPALSWTFFEFTPGYTTLAQTRSASEAFYYGLVEAFFRFTPVVAFGVIASITIRPLHSRERPWMFVLLGIISINVAGIAMQNKFFQYHYAGTLPLIAFMAGIGYYKLWRQVLLAGVGGVVAYVSFLAVALSMRVLVWDLGGTFWERSSLRMQHLFRQGEFASRERLDQELYRVADFDLDSDLAAAREVGARTEPSDSVFVWGFEPAIYWLSERRPASRFIYNVPQRAQWQRDTARALLLQDLAKALPRVVVIQSGDVFPFVTGDALDSRESLAEFPELDELISREYSYATTVRDFELYERRPTEKLGAPDSPMR